MPPALMALGAGGAAMLGNRAMAAGSDPGNPQVSPMMAKLMMLRSDDPAKTAQSLYALQQLPAQRQAINDVYGYTDPKTGISWNGLPMDANQQYQRLQSAFPQQFAAAQMAMMTAPPKNYVHNGVTELMTWPQVMAARAKGEIVGETGPAEQAKVGEGQVETRGPDGSIKIGTLPGYNEAKAGTAYATTAANKKAELQYAGPIAAATAWGSVPADTYKTAFGEQFKTSTFPNPANPSRNVTVQNTAIPGMFGAPLWMNTPTQTPGNSGAPGGPNRAPNPSAAAMPTAGGSNTPSVAQSATMGSTAGNGAGTPSYGLPAGLSEQGKMEKEAAQAEGAMATKLQQIQQLRDAATALVNSRNLGKVTGWGGGIIGQKTIMPGTVPADLQAKIDLVKNRSILDTFQAARDASPTGGGVGRLTDTELPIFANSQAALEQTQSEPEFRKALQHIIDLTNQSEANTRSTFRNEYGRDLRFTPLGNNAGKPSVQDIVNELRNRGHQIK